MKNLRGMASVSSDASDDFEWQPPNEAEMKILQARRDRSDKISKLMGEYLLKGYKMLATTCDECSCILMQDKQKKNYCIACTELDSDTGKDDPACNQEAARRVVEEGRQRGVLARGGSPEPSGGVSGQNVFHCNSSTSPSDEGIETGVVTNNNHTNNSSSRLVNRPQMSPPRPITSATRFRGPGATGVIRPETSHRPYDLSATGGVTENDLVYAQKTVRLKLLQATRDLEQSVHADNSIKMCELIKSCADTLISLYTLQGCTGSASQTTV